MDAPRHFLFRKSPGHDPAPAGSDHAAPGCRFEGEFTEAFTWFPGYAWRFALCAGCGTHLGWEFRDRTSGFAGLIVTELSPS
ncbi:hypothetical protein [Desulfomicrobium orale]|uniref:CULT domain-containing protein n=1 Tax=Desulfomicrobium orale DSM 12838 TaxID=888061 RepID=A0A0X8JN94_9BACT|nr:hypothetical protein [Desulfomicrobium orale]AMD91922.1 hypothetical protein AXF15_01505 [Desulfomicrobium orale DSM 12838]